MARTCCIVGGDEGDIVISLGTELLDVGELLWTPDSVVASAPTAEGE